LAFISEIHYRTVDVDIADSSTHEFVEITLAPGEDPADFVLSFYGNDGALMDDPGDDIQATGVSNAEVTLSDLVGVPDPENPGYTIYTVTSTGAARELINASASQVSDEANYIAVTNTATGAVVDAVGVGRNEPITLSGGEANGTLTTNAPIVSSGQSVQFNYAGNNISGPRTPGNAEVICFCQGTQIRVPGGTRAVEDLEVGDLVETLDCGPQPIRWLGHKTVQPSQLNANHKLRPIRITQGSMGNGIPQKDLLVSRQHRMLTSSQISKRMFGQVTSLVSAIKLTSMPGIFVDASVTKVIYFHILLDEHQVIYAEGAPSESLFLGKQALDSLESQGRAEIYTLFPSLALGETLFEAAAHMPSNKEQKILSNLHAQYDEPLLDTTWQLGSS